MLAMQYDMYKKSKWCWWVSLVSSDCHELVSITHLLCISLIANQLIRLTLGSRSVSAEPAVAIHAKMIPTYAPPILSSYDSHELD